MYRARFLLPGLVLTAFLTTQCSSSESRRRHDDDGGEGGQSGENNTGGVSGSAGSDRAGRTGSGGTSSASGGSGTSGGDGGTTNEGGDGNTGAVGGTNPSSGGDGATGGSSDSGGTGGTLAGSGAAGSGGGTGGSSSGNGGTANGGTANGGTANGGTANGGTANGGTANGGSGGLRCGIGEGFELPIEPGEDSQSAWIDGSSNCVGVQGALYPIVDIVGSTMTITENDGRICVAGTVKRVVQGDYTTYWGARLVMQLNNDGNATALPYDAVAQSVEGFKFTFSGPAVPEEIRPTFYDAASSTQYCKRVCASGAQSILVREAHADCWEGSDGPTPTGTSLQRIEFSIPSNGAADVPFDFCIEALTAIVDDTTVGNPGICPDSGNSCYNACGFSAENCFCDAACLENLTDCCADFEEMCLSD